ncbi:50S ribosomal protein L7/L12 [Blattabacterium cuenoti]|uniref:50S ribosomal protein L7/L12 n=1 Tax=Blattabacterium cuenoti TaxID=1653831 RepID=UPI00163C5F97|nr:50S ribosomal protein L7/L12 [Blattabacterium cuenoti]
MVEKLAEQLVNLTIKQVNELAEILKKKYGIKPNVFQSLQINSNKNKDQENEKKQKNIFDIILKSSGSSKLSVVKLVKEITGKGLKESKDLVDNIPNTIKESVSKEEANILKEKFENIGAQIELK